MGKNFDPVAEAFKVYDPEGSGYVDTEVLRVIFESLGFGEITDDDLAILVETGDVDGDGKISLSDFRHMLDFNKADGTGGGTRTKPLEAAPACTTPRHRLKRTT